MSDTSQAESDTAAARVRTTSERAGRAETALATAGIDAGHPSLSGGPHARGRLSGMTGLDFAVVGCLLAVLGAVRAAWSP